MRKKLCVLMLGLCMISLSACGNKVVSDNSDDEETTMETENDDSESGDSESNDSEKTKISIEDITWNIEEGIIGGERYVLLDFTNNTPYTIAGFEIIFKEKSGSTEENKSTFYSDIQKMVKASDEEIEKLKESPISMHAKTGRVIEPGESITNVNCYYYTGYYYVRDINHYNLVEADIAAIKYVDEDKIYTVYYDYSSGKYSAEPETKAAYGWSQTDLGSKIPKPAVKIVESSIDTEETFMFDAYGMSLEEFNAYIEECKTFGYTIAPNYFEGVYTADDAEGYNISLNYDEKNYAVNGTVTAPDKEPEEYSGEEENNNAASEGTENENADTDTDGTLVNGMRPEFKEAMDSYEAFYDEYCDFMKKYMENPSDMKLLSEYAGMLEKSAEMSERFKAWDNGEMSEEEAKYYLEVNSRITQKLIDAAM